MILYKIFYATDFLFILAIFSSFLFIKYKKPKINMINPIQTQLNMPQKPLCNKVKTFAFKGTTSPIKKIYAKNSLIQRLKRLIKTPRNSTKLALKNIQFKNIFKTKEELCNSLFENFATNKHHAKKVEKISKSLLSFVEKKEKISPKDKMILGYATKLHDIGKFIDKGSDHNKLSSKIIKKGLKNSSGLPISDKKDIKKVALLTKYHRGKINYRKLDKNSLKLLTLLKMADSLEKLNGKMKLSHSVKNDKITIKTSKKKYKILKELRIIKRNAKLFKETFGTKIEIKTNVK